MLPHFILQGALHSTAWLGSLGGPTHPSFFVAVYQSAGSVPFWLINVQFGSIMNRQALITTPLPSQFLAILYLWLLLCLCMCNCLILFWKDFTSLAGFSTILLMVQIVIYLRSLCAFYCVFFHHPDLLCIFLFCFGLFPGCTVLLPLDTALEVFAHSTPGVLFPGHTLNSASASPLHGVIGPIPTWLVSPGHT